MLLHLSSSICNVAMLAIWVNLCEDGPEAPRLFVIPQGGINNEGVGAVCFGVVDNWFGAQGRLQIMESLQGIRWQLTAFPRANFFIRLIRGKVSWAKF
jgi:hypothetical protein